MSASSFAEKYTSSHRENYASGTCRSGYNTHRPERNISAVLSNPVEERDPSPLVSRRYRSARMPCKLVRAICASRPHANKLQKRSHRQKKLLQEEALIQDFLAQSGGSRPAIEHTCSDASDAASLFRPIDWQAEKMPATPTMLKNRQPSLPRVPLRKGSEADRPLPVYHEPETTSVERDADSIAAAREKDIITRLGSLSEDLRAIQSGEVMAIDATEIYIIKHQMQQLERQHRTLVHERLEREPTVRDAAFAEVSMKAGPSQANQAAIISVVPRRPLPKAFAKTMAIELGEKTPKVCQISPALSQKTEGSLGYEMSFGTVISRRAAVHSAPGHLQGGSLVRTSLIARCSVAEPCQDFSWLTIDRADMTKAEPASLQREAPSALEAKEDNTVLDAPGKSISQIEIEEVSSQRMSRCDYGSTQRDRDSLADFFLWTVAVDQLGA